VRKIEFLHAAPLFAFEGGGRPRIVDQAGVTSLMKAVACRHFSSDH